MANIPTPIVKGDHVFASTGYQTGSALLKLSQGRRRRAGEGGLLPAGQDAAEPPRRPGPGRRPHLRRPRPQPGLPDLRRDGDRQGGLGRRGVEAQPRRHRLGRGHRRRRPPLLPLPERPHGPDRGHAAGLQGEGRVLRSRTSATRAGPTRWSRAASSTCASRTTSTSTSCGGGEHRRRESARALPPENRRPLPSFPRKRESMFPFPVRQNGSGPAPVRLDS